MSKKFAELREAQNRYKLLKVEEKDVAAGDESKRSFIETARRAQIISCATDALAELGFARASLAQIAKRADVSPGAILYYFDSKEELFREVRLSIVTVFDYFVLEHMDATTAASALRTIIKANVDFNAHHPKEVTALRQLFFAGLSEINMLTFDPYPAEQRRLELFAILEAGQQSGEFGRFDVWSMVRAITGALDAIAFERIRRPELDFGLYSKELADLFERAVRNDAK